jgi:tetratricopeptide (TPR) repeat protein
MPAVRVRHPLAANLLLVLGSLLFTLLLLALVEGGLRLAGIGAPDAAHASRLKYQQIYLPMMEPGSRPDGTPVLRTTDTRLPYQAILAAKPAHGLRIFIVGGSAAAGLGFSPNVTFARHLERMLERAYPDRIVEVVNLGIVALAARQVQVIVEDICRNYDADAVVVYSGNNEFLEVHARKYATAHADAFTRLRDSLFQTNLYRVADHAIHGGPKTPSLAEQNFSRADLRMTEEALIRDIKMQPEEVKNIIDRYEQSIDAMAAVAGETDTPIVLMTVASNWEWRGREDLPAGWLDEIVPDKNIPSQERYRRAIPGITDRLDSSPPDDRYQWLFKRAVAEEALGELAAARDDYRAAMNDDPHLRRALDAQAERVRGVAARRGVPLMDTIAYLSQHARHGIVGFDEFYDYVHFTPRGVVLVAAQLMRTLIQAGILPEPAGFDPDDYTRERLAWQEELTEDPLAVDEWLGFGFDKGGVADRDLWKYDKFVKSLDARIQENPSDLRALVYRGNAGSFRIDGAGQADQDYRAALAITGDDPVIRSNLERLHAERAP